MKPKVEVVWFKRDLRVYDHAPLSLAASRSPIIPLYIFEPELWRQKDMSYRHYLFLKSSLVDLDKQLLCLGSSLVIKVGNADDIFQDLCSNHEITNISSHQETWNLWTYNRDLKVRQWAKSVSVRWHETPNNGIVRNLKNRSGWAKNWYYSMSQPITTAPKKITSIPITSDKIPSATELGLLLSQAKPSQSASRTAAQEKLSSFLNLRGQKLAAFRLLRYRPPLRQRQFLTTHLV